MDWQLFTQDINQLADKIDYTPDMMIGIARGGVIPTVHLAQKMNIENMHTLKVTRKGNKREITTEVKIKVKNKKVLLVEDMVETGKTFENTKKFFESQGAEVKTACLYTMPHTTIKPDFYIKEVKEVIKFPWEP